jgi:uncharacterized SAM-binding protein YcdF (DUF218 family)
MKFLVDPLLGYLVFQIAGVLVLQWGAAGRSRGILRALLVVTVLLAVFAIPLFARGLEASLVVPLSSRPEAPAFIFVLGGGYLAGNTAEEDILNSESQRRVLQGVAVWRRFPEARLVLSGAIEQSGRDASRHAQLMADVAMSRGVPGSVVVLEPRSRNTRDHPVEALRLPGVTTDAPVALVTSTWHARRARREFCRYFQHVQTYAVAETTRTMGWRDSIPGADALADSTLFLREWMGILWSNLTESNGQRCDPA